MRPFIAMPVRESVPPETMMSVIAGIEDLHKRGIAYAIECQMSGTLCGARNEGVASFLKSNCDIYFTVDSDVVFAPDTMMRALSLAEDDDVDVLTAPYPQRAEGEQFRLLVAPTAFGYDHRGLLPLSWAGLGFTLVKRKVLEKLTEIFPKKRFHPQDEEVAEIFRFGWDGQDFRTEDKQFFEDARAQGFKCWCDCRSILGHMGRKMYVVGSMSSVGNTAADLKELKQTAAA